MLNEDLKYSLIAIAPDRSSTSSTSQAEKLNRDNFLITFGGERSQMNIWSTGNTK